MNESFQTAARSDVPWPTSAERARVPDTSMLPDAERPAAAAVADAAWTDGLRDTLRTTVRRHPLAWIAAAGVLGMVVGRLRR
ncbi:hypothetical protein ACPOLB_00640 [Rubrivivax sp. RP6-9]|uniref:hypothetical protein n=1 Tax=Rubrivivax sp. RP6-9 TaxID=3415750 RepID=UPI003CC6D8F5